MIPIACNFDPSADFQIPGECEFDSCAGCTDSGACNYDLEATFDNGQCAYPPLFYDCEGYCLNDTDGDGICNELEKRVALIQPTLGTILLPQTLIRPCVWSPDVSCHMPAITNRTQIIWQSVCATS